MAIRERQGKKGKKFVVDYYDQQHNRRWRTFPSRKAAERWDSKRRLGEVDDSRGVMSDHWEAWFEVYGATSIKSSTRHGYEYDWQRYLKPYFGELQISQVTRDSVLRFIAEKVRQGYSKTSIEHMLSPMRELFYSLAERGYRLPNPFARTGKYLREAKQPRQKPYPTPAELASFLEAARRFQPRAAHSLPPGWAYTFFLTFARSGLRFGEVCALQAADLDFDRQVIHVQRGIYKGVVGVPKSRKPRDIDMSSQLAEILKPFVTGEGYLFSYTRRLHTEPQPIKYDFAQKMIKQICAMAKIKRFSPHALRHAYASHLHAAGADLRYIQSQLGHHSIKVTSDMYVHESDLKGRARPVDLLDDTGKATDEASRRARISSSPQSSRLVGIRAITAREDSTDKDGPVRPVRSPGRVIPLFKRSK